MSILRSISVVLAVLSCAHFTNGAPLPLWGDQGKFVTAIATHGDECCVATADDDVWVTHGATWQALNLPVDDFATSLAFDRQGRLWVGLGYRGVAVFNGTSWKTYDAPDGPIGHRVFRIAVSPLDGDVWLATDAGLTRYSQSGDSWTSYTRMQGLPADQLSALAFDPAGKLYAATQCDGLAMASPADHYAHWSVVTGPQREPTDASGSGLPSNLINDLLVSKAGVFVATCAGLAVSRDAGASWSYVRGANYVEKVNGRTGGPPPDWQAGDGALTEDDVLSLAAADSGTIWLGYRHAGVSRLNAATLKSVPTPAVAPTTQPAHGEQIRVIGSTPWGTYEGTSGRGLVKIADATTPPADPATQPLDAVPGFPTPAHVTGAQIDGLSRMLKQPSGPAVTAAYLGEDWVTRGDGVGRYGWQHMAFPFYGDSGWAQEYKVAVEVGPHAPNGGPFTWFDDNAPDDERVLYLPNAFRRYQGEWNDGSFNRKLAPADAEGPDLWLRVTVPNTGYHRLSLLFINYDARSSLNQFRDFRVEIKPGSLSKEDADFAPSLTQTRVMDFSSRCTRSSSSPVGPTIG